MCMYTHVLNDFYVKIIEDGNKITLINDDRVIMAITNNLEHNILCVKFPRNDMEWRIMLPDPEYATNHISFKFEMKEDIIGFINNLYYDEPLIRIGYHKDKHGRLFFDIENLSEEAIFLDIYKKTVFTAQEKQIKETLYIKEVLP